MSAKVAATADSVATELAEAASAFLTRRIGSWTTAFHCDQLPEPMNGTAEVRWVVEGRAIVEEVAAEMFGQTVRSVRLLAYNPLRRLMQAVSLEGAGVGLAVGQGRVPGPGEALQLISAVDEPHSETLDMATESLTRIESTDKHVLELYALGQSGREPIGRVVYHRA